MSNGPQQPRGSGADTDPPNRLWIKVTLIVIAAIALIVVAVMLLGGGEHGPWQHGGTPPDNDSPGITEGITEHVRPEGVHP